MGYLIEVHHKGKKYNFTRIDDYVFKKRVI